MVVTMIMAAIGMGRENCFLTRFMPRGAWNPEQSEALSFRFELAARPVQPRR